MAPKGKPRENTGSQIGRKRPQKSGSHRQFREIGVLDGWKQTLEDRSEQNNKKTLIPMSAWAQDDPKRQALAAILAQKGALKSVSAIQFREKDVLDRWKHTLEDRNDKNNENR